MMRVQLGVLRDVLLRAVLWASVDPRYRWLWPPRGWWARLAVAVLAAMTIGFTGGAIAQLGVNMGVSASVATLLGLAQGAPLLLAPRWPLLAWRVMTVGLFVGELVQPRPELWPWPVTSVLAYVVTLFLVAIAHDRRTIAGVGLATASIVVLPASLFKDLPLWLAVLLCGAVALVLVFGDAVRGRYAAEASLAEQTELRRQDLARQAVLEERARIARELHDVVAHHMSVVALQAEAAQFKIPDLPPAALQTFTVIRDAARDALAETRRVVGLLRADDEAPERRPQPGLDRLDGVVEGARKAGLTVETTVVGVPRPIPASVDLSAYRIVQEALSNAARHAPGSRARVEVRYGPDLLGISVWNDSSAAVVAARRPDGGGHGIVGMRERVAMLGGTLSAGQRVDGGFAVVAQLPYDEPGESGEPT
jgi:signal transduction histidine kinase